MEDKKSCPSAPFKEGLSVFAKIENDHFAFTEDLIKIDKEMLETSSGTDYRATMKCVTKGCVNWNGNRCTVPQQMAYFIDARTDHDDYSNCGLKPSCRWFAENGVKACQMCPLIRTKFVGT